MQQSTYITRAKGSKQLREGLQNGDIKSIATHFNKSYSQVHAILSGKFSGDKDIVECAEKIVSFYKEVDLQTSVENIIKSYE